MPWAKDPCGQLTCPEGEIMNTVCASGGGRDCTLNIGGNQLAISNCEAYPPAVDRSKPITPWKWSGNNMSNICENGFMTAGAFSGAHQDCPNSSRTGIRCQPLLENAFPSGQQPSWINAEDLGQNHQEVLFDGNKKAYFWANKDGRHTVKCKPGTYPVGFCNNGSGGNDCRDHGLVPNGGYMHLKCVAIRPTENDTINSLAGNQK